MSPRDFFDASDTSNARDLSVDSPRSIGQRTIHVLSRYERELWFLTLAAMLIDVTLTVHGLQLGLRELNPVARAALDSVGVLGLYGLKGLALLLGLLCVVVIPDRYTSLVPTGLAIPSVAAVLGNTVVISAVVH